MKTEELTKKMAEILMDFENKEACGLDPFSGYGFEQALDEELFAEDEFYGFAACYESPTFDIFHGIETYSMHDESCGGHTHTSVFTR